MEVIIYYDSKDAIALAENPKSYSLSKHIDIQRHYQREKIEDESIEFKFILIQQQIADELTKALTKEKFCPSWTLFRLGKNCSLSESWLFLFIVLQ